ncbi:MAG: hypothetical protein H7Y38_05925 [Armatimonadetes bacterium]|nr:hypothetical protein [Armatimonadota bacterium]
MSVPSNPSLDGGSWSPERELNESAPRRYVPSPYPDRNQPNVIVLLGLGGLLLVVGLVLFFVSSVNADKASDVPYILGGALFSVVGGVMVSIYPAKRKAHLERAANLVENGAPMMARIVKVDNETGDSEYGRLVTYMVNLPGESVEARREVKVDDRVLPKRIPGPTTALLDFRTGDVELYCALPYVAVSKFAAPAASDLSKEAGLPVAQTPAKPTMTNPGITPRPASMPAAPEAFSPPQAGEPDMASLGGLGAMGTQAPPPEEPEAKPKEPKRTAPTANPSAAKLPWEK